MEVEKPRNRPTEAMRRTFWAAAIAALAGTEPWALDFSPIWRACVNIAIRVPITFEEKSSGHSIVIPAPSPEQLAELIERFAGETFGARAGSLLAAGDAPLEGELARLGVDAYHAAFRNYLFCAVCDFENGFLTLLTEKLWTSEVLRRVKPAVAGLPVEVARPHDQLSYVSEHRDIWRRK